MVTALEIDSRQQTSHKPATNKVEKKVRLRGRMKKKIGTKENFRKASPTNQIQSTNDVDEIKFN